MVTFIVVLIVVGLIVGLIARLLVPGRDNIGLLGTIILGIVGSFVGGFLWELVEYHTIETSHFRAVGIMSGILIEPSSKCLNHDIAAWITHGESDTTLPYSDGVSAMNRIVSLDHCGSTTRAVDPSPCVQYNGCDSGEPVVWCSVAGEGHAIPSFAASAIASFFAQF